LTSFLGKTLLTGKDVAGNFLNQEGAHLIKALCGGDLLDAEVKNGGKIQIRGDFNILITSNSRLWMRLDGDAGAWARRLLIIEFNNPHTTKIIPDLAGVLLKEEGPGILKFMIAGAVTLLHELQEHGKYILTAAQQSKIDRLVSESNSVSEFVRQCVSREAHADVTSDQLVEGYTEFCKGKGWHPLPAHTVEKQLPDAMMQIHHASRRNDIARIYGAQRGYKGYTLTKQECHVS
jgi:phage/plasmid-associated DNA primase